MLRRIGILVESVVFVDPVVLVTIRGFSCKCSFALVVVLAIFGFVVVGHL